MWEETGLIVRVVRLIGIYSTPHRVTYYADGNRWQTVSVTFLTAKTGGTLGLSDETTGVGFFSLEEIAQRSRRDPHRGGALSREARAVWPRAARGPGPTRPP